MTTFFRLLDSAADATAAQGGWLSTLLTFLPFVLLIVASTLCSSARRQAAARAGRDAQLDRRATS
ncbi:MAG: hypothetical protein ACLUFV_00130 [Acutalibacteraceae bacterium]